MQFCLEDAGYAAQIQVLRPECAWVVIVTVYDLFNLCIINSQPISRYTRYFNSQQENICLFASMVTIAYNSYQTSSYAN